MAYYNLEYRTLIRIRDYNLVKNNSSSNLKTNTFFLLRILISLKTASGNHENINEMGIEYLIKENEGYLHNDYEKRQQMGPILSCSPNSIYINFCHELFLVLMI